MKIAVYQGQPGAYSYLIAKRCFGESCEYKGLTSFREAFEAVQTGQADFAVMAIENSLIGAIYENYDLIAQYADMHIVGEAVIRVAHCLIGLPGAKKEQIKKVFSHPKALEQCRKFFRAHPEMEALAYFDTAGAAADVSKWNDPSCAAIASAAAAELYGLTVLEKNIEDDPENYTRFVILSKKPSNRETGKCSLAFITEHKPGALLAVLELFAKEHINVTKIESRPIAGKPFEYMFYVDIMLTKSDPALWEKLKEKTHWFRNLGIYEQL